jgi:glycosyltransferase involved in cell wall biosynthesis
MIELSVVLISRNQAWNIARLLKSVLQETSAISSAEILLVDSASTDETVGLASRHPISIVRLQPGAPLSPAIGRYMGYKRTEGDFVLFLDGDTELIPGWLARALRVIRKEPRVGAVTGRVINLPTSAVADHMPQIEKVGRSAPREVLWGSYDGGGAALYRRSVLEQVGTFNPYLRSDEEPELGLRIRHAKYRILELDYPIVRHYNDAPDTISTALGRRKRGFLLGPGQSVRYHLHDPLLWPYIRERGPWSFSAAFWLIVGFAFLFGGLLFREVIWFSSWILGSGVLIVAAAWRKRSLRRAFVCAFHRLLMVEGLLKGFMRKPFRADHFSANADVIKDFRSEEAVIKARTTMTAPGERMFHESVAKESVEMPEVR